MASLLKQIAAVPPEEAENLFGAAETQRLLAAETRLRVSYFLNYLGFLRTALQENQIARSAVNYERIVDAFLLGTASERIAGEDCVSCTTDHLITLLPTEHIAMYGQKLDQYQLQASFYCLFEPELQTCLDLIKEDAVLTKKVLKDLNKYTATYLLDVLVLNTKSRSIFCWSVPEYSGFTPVDDHVLVETNVLLKSRREFFDDSDKIMDVFVKDFKERRVEWYTERKSLRQLLYQGMGFFFLVSFLDMYITQM